MAWVLSAPRGAFTIATSFASKETAMSMPHWGCDRELSMETAARLIAQQFD
jgi:hypothetical protein